MVRFHDNAHTMRKFKRNRRKNKDYDAKPESSAINTAHTKNPISFSDMMGGNN